MTESFLPIKILYVNKGPLFAPLAGFRFRNNMEEYLIQTKAQPENLSASIHTLSIPFFAKGLIRYQALLILVTPRDSVQGRTQNRGFSWGAHNLYT